MQTKQDLSGSNRVLETPQKKPNNSGSLTKSSQQSMKFRFSYEKMELSSSKYTSMNLNYLLGSELKFKSPSKLIELRISESPWANNSIRQKAGNPVYNFSPLFASHDKCQHDPSSGTDTLEHNHTYQNLQDRFLKVVDFGKEQSYQQKQEAKYDDQCSNLSHTFSKNSSQNGIKKRKRKSNRQLEILMDEFNKDEDWSKEKIAKMAEVTGLTESQVYKWCWDQKKKATTKTPEYGKMSKKGELFSENLSRIKTVREKAELLERLGKRKPFAHVNDSRVEKCSKRLKH